MSQSFSCALLFVFVAGGFIGSTHKCDAADPRDAMQKRTYENAAGEKLPYRIFVPKNSGEDQKVALILFLHGAGERGSDNESQIKHAGFLRFATDEVQAKQSAIIVAPQCPSTNNADGQKHQWVQRPWGAKKPHTTPEQPSLPMKLTLELLDTLEKEFNIDPQRRYITGLSMGGYGTFDALIRRPDYWAAAIPICGGADDSAAGKIAHIPVWVFHGDKDGAVPVERSRSIVAALESAGAKPKYTEYARAGHNIWGRAYAEPDLVDWLYGQTRQD